MKSYYEILGLPRSADSSQVRVAYKHLAMQYHPDRNPGNKEAEEIFKIVNEAYHTLSDPVKKSRYDARLFSFNTTVEHTDEYWREVKKRRYHVWKQAQTPTYRFDKSYFKIQGLAFLMFLILSGLGFGIMHTVYFISEKKQEAQWSANSQLLKEVNRLFGNGLYEEALGMINKFEEKDPREYRYSYALDSLVNELRILTDIEFNNHDFSSALAHFRVLQRHERLPRLETLEKIASCQYYVGNYEESIQTFKHVLNQQPWRIDLIYEIGAINLEKTNNQEEALFYFSLGKNLFKKNMSELYGEAFEALLNPADAPDIYYDIFEGRARANFGLQNDEEAITDCNWAIYLRPSKGTPYGLRAQAKANAHDDSGICDDIEKATRLGTPTPKGLRLKYCR